MGTVNKTSNVIDLAIHQAENKVIASIRAELTCTDNAIDYLTRRVPHVEYPAVLDAAKDLVSATSDALLKSIQHMTLESYSDPESTCISLSEIAYRSNLIAYTAAVTLYNALTKLVSNNEAITRSHTCIQLFNKYLDDIKDMREIYYVCN